MADFTPGQWELKRFDCGCRLTEQLSIGYVLEYCSRHAAADDMYEALERALDNKYLWQIEAQAALAKADKEME
jgi:hypothetical protein